MTQPKHPTPEDPLDLVFAYRVFDLRDHFPQPLESFPQALECLQSERAYLPEWRGEIIAYLRGGLSLSIPERFFLHRPSDQDAIIVPPEYNDTVFAEVEQWLRSTLETHRDVLSTHPPSPVRYYSLDELIQQCDPDAPELKELKAWHDPHSVGREVIDPPSEDGQ